MRPDSSGEARAPCRPAQGEEGKGKEGFRRKSATDVQTHFPSGSSASRWGNPATPRKDTMQAEMTSVLGHVHMNAGEAQRACTEGWGSGECFRGPEEQPGTAWKDWPDVENKGSGWSH